MSNTKRIEAKAGGSAPLATVNGYVVRSDFGDAEPRIHDLELARRLGYARPHFLRELIRSMVVDGKLKDVAFFRAARRNDGKGRPTDEAWLTERQALKVIAKSETETADQILDEVIDVFIAVRKGAHAPATHPLLAADLSPWSRMWGRDIQDAACALYQKPKSNRPPRFMGKIQEKLYKALCDDECHAQMKARIPNPRRGRNLHQLFSDQARAGFSRQLPVVIGLMETSHSKDDFWSRLDFLYRGRPMQLPLGPKLLS